MLRIVALCETGTRSPLGAVFGPLDVSENAYAEQLLPLLNDDMLLLNDRCSAASTTRWSVSVSASKRGTAPGSVDS